MDDTVLDKSYSQHMDLFGFFWSEKHHRSVKVINLITLYATDLLGKMCLFISEFTKNLKIKPRMTTL